MRSAGADQPEIARAKPVDVLANLHVKAAFQDVKGFFKGVGVRMDNARGFQVADPGAHMHGASRPIDISCPPEAGTVLPVYLRSFCARFIDL